MMHVLAAAVRQSSDLTQNVWVVVGVPVLVALIGATAAVLIAWRSSRAAITNADRDRRSAAASSSRLERAETYELIVREISALAQQYATIVRAARDAGSSPATKLDHPHRASLVTALARITSRHKDEDVFLALIGWLHAATQRFDVGEGTQVLGLFQARVSAWYLEKAPSETLIDIFDRQADSMKHGATLGFLERESYPGDE